MFLAASGVETTNSVLYSVVYLSTNGMYSSIFIIIISIIIIITIVIIGGSSWSMASLPANVQYTALVSDSTGKYLSAAQYYDVTKPDANAGHIYTSSTGIYYYHHYHYYHNQHHYHYHRRW